MTIQYFTRNVYGNELIYLADDESAELWYRLSGKKTITRAEMRLLRELMGEGSLEFERVFEPAEVL